MSHVIIDQTERRLITTARKFGCKLVIPTNNELVLDLDEGLNLCDKAFQNMMGGCEIADPMLCTTSRNGNRHMYIRLADYYGMPIGVRIVYQAALGSDPVKEMMSIQALSGGAEVPVAMFETPEEYMKVMDWRQKFKTIPY